MKKFFIISAAALAVSCGNGQKSPEQTVKDSTIVALTDTVKPEVAAEPEVNDPELDAKAEAMIREFYNECVWGDKYYSAESQQEQEAILSQYCTKSLIEWLAEDYEFDGTGYAIWDFRSNAQDSNGENEIYSIEPKGAGKYKVSFNDGGTNGSCVLNVVVEGDNIKFDEISDRYTEE